MCVDSPRPLTAAMHALQGSGKSSIGFQLALRADKPHVIHVDLAGCSSFDQAARRVADKVGYPLQPTAAEALAVLRQGARADWNDEWGWEQYSCMLDLFVRACKELHDEKRLSNSVCLIIDEATRPFSGYSFTPADTPSSVYPKSAAKYTPAHDTLMEATVNAVNCAAGYSAHFLRVVALASRITRDEPWIGECMTWALLMTAHTAASKPLPRVSVSH